MKYRKTKKLTRMHIYWNLGLMIMNVRKRNKVAVALLRNRSKKAILTALGTSICSSTEQDAKLCARYEFAHHCYYVLYPELGLFELSLCRTQTTYPKRDYSNCHCLHLAKWTDTGSRVQIIFNMHEEETPYLLHSKDKLFDLFQGKILSCK